MSLRLNSVAIIVLVTLRDMSNVFTWEFHSHVPLSYQHLGIRCYLVVSTKAAYLFLDSIANGIIRNKRLFSYCSQSFSLRWTDLNVQKSI